MDKRETLVSRKPREYMSQKRTRLASKVKAALKKAGKVTRWKLLILVPHSIIIIYAMSCNKLCHLICHIADVAES